MVEREGGSVAEVQLFREDVVHSLSQPEVFGLVSKVAGDSSDSDTSDSDEDDKEAEKYVAEGCARIVWINSKETTEKVSDICVVDRSFLHGDIVAATADPLGQTGTVVDVQLFVDLELPTNELVKELDSRRLRRVRTFMPGDYVLHGMWLGRVEEVIDNVTVLFDDGAKCKVLRADTDRLLPISESLMDDTGSPYYPGQRVRATSSGVFKGAKWLRSNWKGSRMEGVVVDVEAGSVVVYWVAAGTTSAGKASTTVPAEQQDPHNLHPMTYFLHTNWQLGDRTLLPAGFKFKATTVGAGEVATGSDECSLEMEPAGHGSPVASDLTGECAASEATLTCEVVQDSLILHKRRSTKQQQWRAVKKEKKALKKEKAAECAALVVSTTTTVDVLWQDGTLSNKVNASSLIPVDHLGDHDFWPQQYVLERGSDGEGLDNEMRRAGIVKSVDAKQRTAVVRWLKLLQGPDEPREFDNEETVSVYELVEHPDYGYCLGDVVIRLSVGPSKEPLPGDESEGTGSSGLEGHSEVDVDETDSDIFGKERGSKRRGRKGRAGHRGKLERVDLSWAGLIIGLHDGDIEVAWADGVVSKVGPELIFVVSRDDDDVSSAHTSDLEDLDDNDGDDAASWETMDSSDETAQRAHELRAPWDQLLEAAGRLEEHTGDEADSPSSDGNQRDGHPEPKERKNAVEAVLSPSSCNPRRFRGPISACIGLVSRLAAGLLGFRAGRRGEGGVSWIGLEGVNSKHGLEEILDGEQAGSPVDSRRVVDRSSSSSRDAVRMLESSATSAGREEDEDKATSLDDSVSLAPDHSNVSGRSAPSPESSGQSESYQEYADTTAAAGLLQQPSTQHAEAEKITGEEQAQRKAILFRDFKHFDSVSDPLDHHFFGETAQFGNQRKWVKKIQDDWSILEKNLPDTIYVRVYEDRMDLLRAVIVGAPGTPYHDGLFVFDLYFPFDYPNIPPRVFYHSGGLRLNPNLYENGKVCLSLLNTWTGKGTEVWDPSTSSMLQLLVSIQGLVLNAKPYFNEAGYDRQTGTAEGEKNSIVYNENAFLLSCKSMLYLLRRPPMHLEDLIQQHFVLRGAGVLRACKAYLGGAPVGSLVDNHTEVMTLLENELHGVDKSSAGFKLMLAKLVDKLSAAFSELGVDLNPLSTLG